MVTMPSRSGRCGTGSRGWAASSGSGSPRTGGLRGFPAVVSRPAAGGGILGRRHHGLFNAGASCCDVRVARGTVEHVAPVQGRKRHPLAPTKRASRRRAGESRERGNRAREAGQYPSSVMQCAMKTDPTDSGRALRRFTSGNLTGTLASMEGMVRGLDAGDCEAFLERTRAGHDALAAAAELKRMAGQVDVTIHALGILLCLPHILEAGETVEYVSLGAGNTGRRFDLETNLRIAEFSSSAGAGERRVRARTRRSRTSTSSRRTRRRSASISTCWVPVTRPGFSGVPGRLTAC